MKIGIDIQTTLGEKTGFGNYVNDLVENIKKIDKKNQYFLFKPELTSDLSTPQRFIWDQFKFPKYAKNKKVDILHQPCFSAPIFYSGKIVVTVHDLIALLYGKDIPFYSSLFFARWMPFTYKKADKIIAISEHTKKDIIKFLKIPQEKIKVIYSAAEEQYSRNYSKDQIKLVLQKYNITGDYLLHIGTLNPRKNLNFLIKVFSKIVKEYPNLQLVITGKKGWYYEGLFILTEELGLKDKIIFTGYISDKDKPILYSGAKIFVFPSLYEGFGLPPLEAMSAKIPVISSNTSSLPEVIGKGGILLPPDDEFGWVKSIKLLLSNEKIYQKFAQDGYLQSKKFSWEKCARETISVYEEVINK